MATHRLAALAVLALLGGCASERTHTMSFASWREAQDAGAIERGWLPTTLPAGAYELRVAYEPSGSRRWGLFNFRPEDADVLRAAIGSSEISLDGLRTDIPARIEWWPVAMRGDLDGAALAASGLRAYRGHDARFIYVVNWNQGRAYYWTAAP